MSCSTPFCVKMSSFFLSSSVARYFCIIVVSLALPPRATGWSSAEQLRHKCINVIFVKNDNITRGL